MNAFPLFIFLVAAGSLPTAAQDENPAFKAIEVQQSGGFAGVNIHYHITPDGKFTRKSRQGTLEGKLDAKEVKQLAEAVAGIDWKKLPKELRDPKVADDFVYEMHFVIGKKTHRVTADGTSAGKHEQLKSILQTLTEIQRRSIETGTAHDEAEQRFQEEFPLLHGLHSDSKSPHALKPLDADRETDPVRKLKLQRYNTALVMCDICLEESTDPARNRPSTRDLLAAVNDLTEARLSLAETDQEKLKLLEYEVGLFKEIEKTFQILGSKGREGEFVSKEVYEVRYARLTSEIRLMEAKKQ